jgi:biotin carboxyl carrier protein
MSTTESRIFAEDVRVPVRIIAAPAAGIFTTAPAGAVTEGARVHAGQSVGFIERSGGRLEVSSFHAGRLAGLLAHPGERVREGQPVAWVHVTG